MICFEYIILIFSKLVEWTGSGKTNKIAMREVTLSAVKKHKIDIDNITDKRTLEYLMGFKQFSTERVIKAVTYELMENDEWPVKGKLMGECWHRACCVLKNADKRKGNVGRNISGNAKVRRVLEDEETQRILLGGSLTGMEQC